MSLTHEINQFNEVHPNLLQSVTELPTAEFLVGDMVVSPIPKETRINVLASHLGKSETAIKRITRHLKIIANLI